MEESIKFSIIIPAFNSEKYITETLDSVRKQTYSNYEIIVINDGSTDNTPDIIKDYFSSYPSLPYRLIEQMNRGIGGARNAGIKEAKGDFIAFLDSDDKWKKDKLFKINDFIEKKTQIDLVCHDEYLISNNSKRKLIYGPYKLYRDLLFKKNCISTSATVVRKNKLFEAGLFSEDMNFNGAEDYELWLRLSKICKIEYLHELLGEYTIHNSAVTGDLIKHAINTINVVNSHFMQWSTQSIYYKLLMIKRRARILTGAIYRSCKARKLNILLKLLIDEIPMIFKT